MSKVDYRRRATECLAFANISRDEEERSQMLIMARTLLRLADEREMKETKRANKDMKVASRNDQVILSEDYRPA